VSSDAAAPTTQWRPCVTTHATRCNICGRQIQPGFEVLITRCYWLLDGDEPARLAHADCARSIG
jgi:hypothetical protein